MTALLNKFKFNKEIVVMCNNGTLRIENPETAEAEQQLRMKLGEGKNQGFTLFVAQNGACEVYDETNRKNTIHLMGSLEEKLLSELIEEHLL
jgi:hypothetical protein